jgi:hypothetical protein
MLPLKTGTCFLSAIHRSEKTLYLCHMIFLKSTRNIQNLKFAKNECLISVYSSTDYTFRVLLLQGSSSLFVFFKYDLCRLFD